MLLQPFLLLCKLTKEGERGGGTTALQHGQSYATLAVGPVGTSVTRPAGGRLPAEAVNVRMPGGLSGVGHKIEGLLPPGDAGVRLVLIVNMDSHDPGPALKEKLAGRQCLGGGRGVRRDGASFPVPVPELCDFSGRQPFR